MSALADRSFQVAVVGAGPVGCVAAIVHARAGAHVLLLEANPKGARQLAGEWLHPTALDLAAELGVPLGERTRRYPTGDGFVVFPDDGPEPVVLKYGGGAKELSCEHSELVGVLRDAAQSTAGIEYVPHARALAVEGDALKVLRRGLDRAETVRAGRIVGADGRHSIVRAALGLPVDDPVCSSMVGIVVEDITLPFEGFGHVFAGGPGPLLAYRIGPRRVRIIADIPGPGRGRHEERTAYLWEAYGPMLPEGMRPAFRGALLHGRSEIAINSVRSRSDYGRGPLALVGDAAGHYHPLTAIGMTLGFEEAADLARSTSVEAYRRRRIGAVKVPELLAVGMYEAFAQHDDAALATRRAMIDLWRGSRTERARTMRFLAGEDRRLVPFARSFMKIALRASLHLSASALRTRDSTHCRAVASATGSRILWLFTGQRRLQPAFARTPARPTRNGGATPVIGGDGAPPGTEREPDEPHTASAALARGIRALLQRQRDTGEWEGEVVWCPMLAAQYVLMCHITGTPIADARRRRLLLHFHRTRLPDGLWGLHEHSEPYLYVTVLVYVAARLLGVPCTDPRLAPARGFIRREGGATAILSWGKFWLAMIGLFDWRGLNPVLPEAWLLPRRWPVHPSKLYCHTRLIYLAMAVIYARRLQAPLTSVIEELRAELFPEGFHAVNWRRARTRLRGADLYRPPGIPLRLLYRASRLIERWHRTATRDALIKGLLARIRWELRTTDYTSISPVSGLLNIIALWIHDPDDPALRRAVERFEGWIWEDDSDGTRVAGARSATWDTAFALQALTATGCEGGRPACVAGGAFLKAQQIRDSLPGFAEADRIDPKGGWCFAGVWHGWPVSDCAAEAMTALMTTPGINVDPAVLRDGVRFVLRCQNRDGGFGSYEPQRAWIGLEWLNPAEMFGDSMTEMSFVECTASCLQALALFQKLYPDTLPAETDAARRRATGWLRREQRADGSWAGAWGVCFIYGTMFGVHGLLAGGAPVHDQAIRKACRWLLARQRPDGGWGEHHSTCRTGIYREHPESQVIQSAWALKALLEARDPTGAAVERGVRFLARSQGSDGEWPKQDMAGVFFRTALLDYTLHRLYFPVWALGMHEAWRRERLPFLLRHAGPAAGREDLAAAHSPGSDVADGGRANPAPPPSSACLDAMKLSDSPSASK